MRYFGIIIVALLILEGCKTATVSTSVTEYNENLAVLRPDLSEEEEVAEDSQTPENSSESVAFTQHIKTELDSVDKLIIERNRQQEYVDGYTIQIYTGSKRQEADSAKARALRLDPSLRPKITYYQPNYKVKVGEYTDRLKAHEVYTFIKREFPLALLIPDRIKVDYD